MGNKTSTIRKVITAGGNDADSATIQTTYVVDLYQDDVLLETRELPGKSKYYAEDVAENWENGIIKLATDK